MNWWQWLCQKDPLFNEPDRPSVDPIKKAFETPKDQSREVDLWCPFAEIVEPEMKTRGKYRKGYPEGAVVHYTAGRPGLGSFKYGRKKGYCYLYIDRDGTIYQSSPLDRWGWHAGKSHWPGFEGGVSRYFVGIEMASAGLLKDGAGGFFTWWGEEIPPKETRRVERLHNMKEGVYQVYTSAQEESLKDLLLWLKFNNPDIFRLENVVGHDEVSPNRKSDPGGSLSWPMPEFRSSLMTLCELEMDSRNLNKEWDAV